MNYRLAKEIYGQAWFMDALSWQKFAPMLKNDADFSVPKDAVKDNRHYLVKAAAQPFDISEPCPEFSEMAYNEKYISVIKFDGAITKDGGMSHCGTVELGQNLLAADLHENIIGHIFIFDSGGGSASAVEEFKDALAQVKKPIVSFIEGMAASAAYYIASFSDHIISKRKTNFVGSIGTMMEFGGYPKKSEDVEDGYRRVRIYATKSTLKNNEFEQAINDFNFQPLLDKMLNPANEIFLSDIKKNRPNVTENQLSGDIFAASEVVSTLIDEIGSFDKALKKVEQLSLLNQKSEKMNKTELKQLHPAVYAEILAEGATQERDRVEAILTYVDVDAKACTEMVKAGATPTQKFYAEMNRKALTNDMVQAAKAEAIPTIETPAEIKADVKSQADAEFELAIKEAAAAARM